MKNINKWESLSIKDKADLMKLYIKNGINNLEEIRSHYNKFSTGGYTEEEGKKEAVVRTPEDEKVSKLTRSYYKEVNPLAGYPGFWDALKHGANVILQMNYDKDSTAYPVTDMVADATWRKRLGLSYDEKYLPSNEDGSVRLPLDRELEIPIDTNLLKSRINSNLKLSKKYEKEGRSRRKEIVDWAINEDQAALDSLRHTFKTGEPVVLNEQAYNSRALLKDGILSMPGSSPLNPLQNYTIQYNKDKDVMEYRDVYDFNGFDWIVPGKSYKIKGEIPLKKKFQDGGEKEQSYKEYLEDLVGPLSPKETFILSVYNNESNGNLINKAKKLRTQEADKYKIPYIKDKEIRLKKGRFNTGKISTNLLDSIYNAAQRTNTPLNIALGLAGRESTLGIGRGFKEGNSVSGTDLYSNWQQIQPILVGNKGAKKEYDLINKYNNYVLKGGEDLTNEEYIYLLNTAKKHKKELEVTKPLQENPIDNALRYFISGKYNPGDSKHTQMVIDDGNLLLTEPAIIEWLNTKK